MDKLWRKNKGASDFQPVALTPEPRTIALGWTRAPGDGFCRLGFWAGEIE